MPSWPRGRLTTYNFQSVPAIASADLNAFQDAIVDINDCALFTPAVPGTDTPMAPFVDGGGNQRFIIDHNALPIGGRLSRWREEWQFLQSQVGTNFTTSQLSAPDGSHQPVHPLLVWGGNGGSNMTAATIDAGAVIGGFSPLSSRGHYLKILNGDAGAATNRVFVAHANPIVAPGTYQTLVASWEMAVTGGRHWVSQICGFSDVNPASWITGIGGAIQNSAFFYRDGTVVAAPWSVVSAAGGVADTGTGGTPVAVSGDFQSFTLELHGASTPYGILNGNKPIARFFVDGTLLKECKTHVPFSAMSFFQVQAFDVGLHSPDADVYHAVGPIEVIWNRQHSPVSP